MVAPSLSPRAGIRCNACGTSLASLTAPCRCKNVHGERDRFAPPPSMPTKAGVVASKPKRPRAGLVTEALLCAVLDRCGLIDAFNAGPTTAAEVVYVREFAWGIYLPEPRLFRFDAAVPARRLAFEADGGAHYATKRQGQKDTERRGLAAAHGWRVVAMRPDQIHDRTADELVRAALEVTTS